MSTQIDPTTDNFHKAIVAAATKKLGRDLTDRETLFVTSRGSYLALESIMDTVQAGTQESIARYLNSEL